MILHSHTGVTPMKFAISLPRKRWKSKGYWHIKLSFGAVHLLSRKNSHALMFNAWLLCTQTRYTTVIILCTQKKISAYKSSRAKIGICTLFQKLEYVFALFARNLLGIENENTIFASKRNKEQKPKNNGKERS